MESFTKLVENILQIGKFYPMQHLCPFYNTVSGYPTFLSMLALLPVALQFSGHVVMETKKFEELSSERCRVTTQMVFQSVVMAWFRPIWTRARLIVISTWMS